MKVTEVPGCRTVDKEKKSGNIQHFNQNNDYSSHLKNSCSTNREKNKEINFINCPSSEKGSHDVMLQSSQKSESETLFKENNKNQTLMNHNKELEKKGENKFSHVHNTEEMKKPVNVNTGKQKSSSLEPQTIIEINNISNSTIVSNTDTSSANGFTQKHTSPPNDENGSGLRRSKRRMSNQGEEEAFQPTKRTPSQPELPPVKVKRRGLTLKEQEQIERQKRFEKRNQHRQKYLQQMQQEEERKRTEKSMPCKYYVKHGRCDFGDECKNSHNIDVSRKEGCKFYIQGFCLKGASCLFMHENWPCRFFHLKGFCNNGDKCRFSHVPLTDEMRKVLTSSINREAGYSARSGRAIGFHRIPPKAYAEKSDQVQLFSRGKFRKPIILLRKVIKTRDQNNSRSVRMIPCSGKQVCKIADTTEGNRDWNDESNNKQQLGSNITQHSTDQNNKTVTSAASIAPETDDVTTTTTTTTTTTAAATSEQHDTSSEQSSEKTVADIFPSLYADLS